MLNQLKAYQKSENYKNGLSTRLQQIIDVLYKNNGQFAKGLPSEQLFKEMLEHSYICYDQLDFIILEYSRHQVNYLEPKLIAEHMHKIMRVTKYLFNNIRNWIQSYSLDIAKKLWEDKTYFPAEADHQARCSSCNRYVEEMLLKQTKQEILGWHDARLLYEQELKESQEDQETRRPLSKLEMTEYTGSVNYLTKIIKEMEESAHGYSKLAETVEKEDNQQNIALKYLEDLLKSMRRRLGEKCIYRLKKILKNWEKNQNEGHQEDYQFMNKGPFIIRPIISESYIPPIETKKHTLSSTNIMLKRLKDENNHLHAENIALHSNYTVARNSLTFLEKREEMQKREMDRLNGLLQERNMEKNMLASELRSSSRRRTANTEPSFMAISPKATATANSFVRQSRRVVSPKKTKYSKFKVNRMSRQSEAHSNNYDKAFHFINGENMPQSQNSEDIDNHDSQVAQHGTFDVGCQWEDPYPNQRPSKMKQANSRVSKQVKINTKQRLTVSYMSQIDERQEDRQGQLKEQFKFKGQSKRQLKGQSRGQLKGQQSTTNKKDNKRPVKLIDLNIKSKNKLPSGILLALQDTKTQSNQSNTLKQLFNSQKTKNTAHNDGEEYSETNQNRISVKVLESEQSKFKISLEKINTPINKNKAREVREVRELKSPHQIKVSMMKTFLQPTQQSAFTRQIQKIVNKRIATEGNQLKKKPRLIKNLMFKPEHLKMFGGVSESYSYQKITYKDEGLTEQQKKCLLDLKNHLVNLRSFKNHLYDNIVMFLKWPFTMIDSEQMELKIVGDKQLATLLKKFITFHHKKCQKLSCEHLQNFYSLIGLYHNQ